MYTTTSVTNTNRRKVATNSKIQYIRPETEPEWDVDSFDGHEFKISKMYRSQQYYDRIL